MSLNLPPDLQDDLDAHLDAVDAALVSGGKPRRERQEVLDSLTDQALEMLAQEAGDATPDRHGLTAVLRQLDPPSAYGPAPTTFATANPSAPTAAPIGAPPRRLDPLAVWAMGLVVFSVPASFGVTLGVDHIVLALIAGLAAVTTGAVLGITSIARIRAAPARWYGYPLAFSAVVAVPTVLLSFSHVPIVGPLVSIAQQDFREHEQARKDWLFSNEITKHKYARNGYSEELAAMVKFPTDLQARPKPWILRYQPALFLVPIAILFAATMWINVKLYRRFKPAGLPPAASVA